MICAATRFRALTAVVLAMSITTAVAFPSISAGVHEARCKRAKHAAKTCCCGTEHGRCCGMACCLPRTPNQVPALPRGRAYEDSLTTLALVLANGDQLAQISGDSDCVASSSFCGSLAAPTLQSRHIRIQT